MALNRYPHKVTFVFQGETIYVNGIPTVSPETLQVLPCNIQVKSAGINVQEQGQNYVKRYNIYINQSALTADIRDQITLSKKVRINRVDFTAEHGVDFIEYDVTDVRLKQQLAHKIEVGLPMS